MGTFTGPPPADGRRPLLAAHFLGTFQVTIDGVPVDTTSRRRTRHVLAYLLAHRRAPVPRDVLIEALWPGTAPAAARNSLHVALSHVRQALRTAHPRAAIERRFDTYRIADAVAVWTDIERFERHRAAGALAERRGDQVAARHDQEAACQLYGGDFLADEPYVEWAAPIRDGLRLDVIDVQGRLVERYLADGAYGPAAVLARRLLEIDPCNEAVHRRLMTCYAAAGQRHLALSQYHRLVELLWTALRVRPSSRTTALFEELSHPRHDRVTRVA
ncbi:BTAD domain-containing putative transcriptional regulator [Actinoplanes sp. ATCC 53533]|uniref:AfsR/SARP family transcriptional regulator n=1 Tax=Actinoplanes sp. ATCC 53533 TaxID=1288362 RepID=UPI00131519AD|nr:BTAD domain-containing putative transcriptional regulator [Actinoplanes sp. ATCC 53533]